ncbi:MAG TPA: AzlD domain-containing protein [Azospirillaceae bacterium]|nr:AzlD domain-containing protein [Azospirillaceae bacterium]
MTSETASFALILGLGLVCFAVRAGGFLVAGLLPMPPVLLRLLKHLPGALLAAMVTATALSFEGWAGPLGAAVSVATMAATRNELVSGLIGAGAAALALSMGG